MKKGIQVKRFPTGIIQEYGHKTTSLAVEFDKYGARLLDAGEGGLRNPSVELPTDEDGYNTLIGILIEAKQVLFDSES